MNFLSKHRFVIVGIILGAFAGFLYYSKVGCVSGTCAITSSPINSTLYGALLGYLFVGLFKKEEIKENGKNHLNGEQQNGEKISS